MKSKKITSEQFDNMMTKKLMAHHDCCSDILKTLGGIAIGSVLSPREAEKQYNKAMDMMHDAIQTAGDEIVKDVQ